MTTTERIQILLLTSHYFQVPSAMTRVTNLVARKRKYVADPPSANVDEQTFANSSVAHGRSENERPNGFAKRKSKSSLSNSVSEKASGRQSHGTQRYIYESFPVVLQSHTLKSPLRL